MRTLHHKTLERETGIEPATNSLEGCDSTTELLPPPAHALSGSRFGGASPPHQTHSLLSLNQPTAHTGLPTVGRLRRARGRSRSYGGRRLVAREGLEPSKP